MSFEKSYKTISIEQNVLEKSALLVAPRLQTCKGLIIPTAISEKTIDSVATENGRRAQRVRGAR